MRPDVRRDGAHGPRRLDALSKPAALNVAPLPVVSMAPSAPALVVDVLF